MLPNVTHRLETNRIKTVTALVTGAFLLTACGSSPDTTVTTEYYRFANQPQDNDVPDAELDEDVLTGLNDHYFRYLGVRDSTEFYMARTDHEDTTSQGLCFIAVEKDTETPASQCAGPEELDDMVLHLHANSFSPPVEAFLAPDGIEGHRPDYAGGSEDFTLERSSSSET